LVFANNLPFGTALYLLHIQISLTIALMKVDLPGRLTNKSNLASRFRNVFKMVFYLHIVW
jgi:hypothetical protein